MSGLGRWGRRGDAAGRRQLWVAYMAGSLPPSAVRGLLLLLASLAGQLREGAAWLGAVGP